MSIITNSLGLLRFQKSSWRNQLQEHGVHITWCLDDQFPGGSRLWSHYSVERKHADWCRISGKQISSHSKQLLIISKTLIRRTIGHPSALTKCFKPLGGSTLNCKLDISVLSPYEILMVIHECREHTEALASTSSVLKGIYGGSQEIVIATN